EAREAARRDVLAAIARFISVKAESTFESSSSHVSKDGVSEEHEEAHQEISARADESLESLAEVKLSGEYWQRIATKSGGKSDGGVYRCFLRALVPAETVARARLETQIARARRRGEKIVAIAEFSDIREELIRRLAAEKRIFIVEQLSH